MNRLYFISYLLIIFMGISCVGDPIENAQEREELETIRLAPPTVSSITSSLSDGAYTIAQVIDIDIKFSKMITTSTSSLTLDNGAIANYQSGSGGSTVTYRYTVGATQDSTDLDITSITAGDISDSVGNPLINIIPSGANLADNKNIMVDTTASTITNISSTLTNGTYGLTQVIDIDVTFNEIITTSTSSLTLDSGANAIYQSGSGTSIITYRYTVAAAENSTDLSVTALTAGDAVNEVAIATSTVLPGAANLADNKAIVVDTTAPTITDITSTLANATYGVGQVVDIVVTFDEAVTTTTGTLTLDTTGTASYSSGSGTTAITFQYTVLAGQNSGDLNVTAYTAGDSQDLGGNALTVTIPAADLITNKNLVIDTTLPTVVSITSVLADSSYTTAQAIDIVVTYDLAVTTATSTLTLDTGATANYQSGSGTALVTYRYTVAALEASTDLTVASITAGDAVSVLGNPLTTAIPGGFNLSDSKAIIIDTIAPTIVGITSTTPGNGTYNLGQVIDIIVTFSEATNTTGSTLTFFNGATAALFSGSTTTASTYRYNVGATENSTDLNIQTFNSAGSTDIAGNPTTTTLPGGANLADNQAMIIDTLAPAISSMTAVTPGDGSYNSGDTIDIVLNFPEPVVTSTATITLNTPGDVVTFTSGSGTNSLTFQYTVGAGDTATDLAVTAFTIGNATDVVGNVASATLPGGQNLSDTQDIIIDTTAPTITNITSAKTNGTYGIGSIIYVEVTFDEVVYSNTSSLTLDTTASATYHSGNGTTTLNYQYTITSPQTSLDLTVNSITAGDAADKAGNAITTALPGGFNLADNKALVIDTTQPTITGITSALADGDYTIAQIIDIDVTYDEAVTTATSTLTLDNGATAAYESGSTTATITYRYTVAAAEDSADLTVTTVNIGDAVDVSSNPIDPTIGGGLNLADTKALVIDTTASTITGITSLLGDGTYGPTQTIDIDVTFDDVVTAGTSTLTLNNGAIANYQAGTGTTTVTYRYTVAASQTSAALNVTIVNAGTAVNSVAIPIDTTLPIGANLADVKAFVIDTTGPTITGITSALANGTYTTAQIIDILVTFDEAVTTTTSALTLDNGGSAAYEAGTGTTTVTYRYTVGALQDSTDLTVASVTIGNAVDAYTNAISATLPGAANLADSKALVINTTPAVITNITSALADGTYGPTDVIDINVTFDEGVTTTTSLLTLANGATAAYQAGTTTSTITYRYTVGATGSAEDSADLAVGSITANDAVNGVALPIDTTLPGANNLDDNKALAIDTTAPTITNITSTKADGIYGIAETIDVVVTFDKAVTTTTASLSLDTVGGIAGAAAYATGSGTTSITFQYTVATSQNAGDLNVTAYIVGDSVDAVGNVLTTTLPGTNLANNKAIVIDTTAPNITGITSALAASTYGVGQIVDIVVAFDKAVTTATSSLTMDTGATASYFSGSTTAAITYRYTVATSQNSLDLDVTTVNAGDAVDTIGNPITTTIIGNLATTSAIVIDTNGPAITNITSVLADGTYTLAQVIDIVVTFDEAVTTTNSTLTLDTGATASYLSGTGTVNITYRYTVAASESSSDLDVTALTAGDAADATSNTISTTLSGTSLLTNKALVIDSTVPTITSITSVKTNGTYSINEVFDIDVTYSEAVTTATSTLTLDNGGTATYQAGSTTTTVTYRYTVAALEDSADLTVTSVTAGDAVDANSNALSTSLPAGNNLADNKALVIVTATPTVTSISPQGGSSGGSTSVTISGTNFNLALASSNIQIGGNNCTLGSVTATQIICTTAAHANGYTDIVVTNPDTQSATLSNGFLYSAPITITSLSQSTGTTLGGNTIAITGSGFDFPDIGLTSVKIGSTSCGSVTVSSATQLTCVTTATTAGTYNVVVTQLFQEATLSSSFTFVSGPVLSWQVGTTNNPEDWGSPGANTSTTFTLENTGTTTSSTITLSLSGTNSTFWTFGTDNCTGTTLTSAATCTVQVIYLWDLITNGSHSATLSATATSGGSSTNSLLGNKP
jgi:hypothetical protein